VFGLFLVPPAVAQETGPEKGAAEGAAEQEAPEIDVSEIDRILRGEEEVMQGDVFFYDPAGRRDPFRSLLEGLEDTEETGKRPPGLAGMMISELTVEGVIETPDGTLAFVQGRDNLSYILREGTKLYNGEVKQVLPDQVVFKKQVDDPKALKPFTEVVREVGQK
jgi:hypothetical protein